jgi:hypothetical protein
MTLTRRSLLVGLAITLSALGSSRTLAHGGIRVARRTHTLSLHMDRTFAGYDDTLSPYRPRGVIGGARALAALSDTELRARYPYF